MRRATGGRVTDRDSRSSCAEATAAWSGGHSPDLAESSSRLATAWRHAGLRPGDRVTGLCGQQIEAYVGALAAWRSGLVYMPLFAGFGPQALAERLCSGEPSAVVVDHRFRQALESARALTDRDLVVYTVPDARGRGLIAGDRSFWAEIDRHVADSPALPMAAGDTATLIYTSGTTGAPKGCMIPHSALLTVQPFVRHVLALRPDDLLFTGADPGWSYGLYTTGAAVMALGHPRVIYSGPFDPRRLAADLGRGTRHLRRRRAQRVPSARPGCSTRRWAAAHLARGDERRRTSRRRADVQLADPRQLRSAGRVWADRARHGIGDARAG